MNQYQVIGKHIHLPAGSTVSLDEEQAKLRSNLLKEIEPGVFETLAGMDFIQGDILGLDHEVPLNLVQSLAKPGTVDLEEKAEAEAEETAEEATEEGNPDAGEPAQNEPPAEPETPAKRKTKKEAQKELEESLKNDPPANTDADNFSIINCTIGEALEHIAGIDSQDKLEELLAEENTLESPREDVTDAIQARYIELDDTELTDEEKAEAEAEETAEEATEEGSPDEN